MRSTRNSIKLYPIIKDIQYGDLAPDGGQYRPHVVWFEEAVPMIEEAIPVMADADIFVLIGTSLAVYPAAGVTVNAWLPPYATVALVGVIVPLLPAVAVIA